MVRESPLLYRAAQGGLNYLARRTEPSWFFRSSPTNNFPERAERTAIEFHYRKDIAHVGDGLENYKTDTGSMKVSSPELTTLDLLLCPRAPPARFQHRAGTHCSGPFTAP